uniref:Cytochrome P450 n=1 Tax=Aedes aegypti TaxID=7159 RepID=A0A1D8GRD4_AEDAE|nr:cytochrome P450 [Aedes aegypti]
MEVNLVYLAVVLAVIAYLYRWITRNNDYFHDKPIPSMAVRPFLGASGSLVLRKVSFPDFIQTIYNKFPGVKVFGMFETITPFFVIRDPELIKQIAIKDFDHFVDHRPTFGLFDEESAEHPNALFRKTLFSMTGQRWKEMRATLSPAFTGSKMRLMFSLMGECFDGMIDHYVKKAKTSGRVEVEVKDMMSRVSINVIASCAFGIKVDCFKDQDHEFLRHGKKMMDFARPIVIARMMAMRVFPKLSSRFGIDLLDPEQARYFTHVFQETIKARESHGTVRNDMIDLLLQARKGTLKFQEEKNDQEGFATVQESDMGKVEVTKQITESEMIAQCLVFFLGGFDTVSTCAMFMAYELVRNPEVQQKLYEEVLETSKELAGKPLSYDALQKMKYMDMVVSETLRIWPLAPATDRLCTKDYTIDDGQGLKFTIDKGTCVWFPAAGLHHNPQYFPNPERFDPERFNDENKRNINVGAYLPFGIGPRNCIGSRFALMEVKAVMYYTLLKFTIVRSAKTQIPMQLRKGFTNLGPEKGMHVELKLR